MTDALVIIQARTGSRRLPAKSLITFRGQPIAVLAAQRAATRGHKVVIATSDDDSDDLLAATIQAAGIALVRGPLDDVLDRFCLALGTVSDDTTVLRLTGDNIVPDGDLVTEVIETFEASGADYMSTGTGSGLPYGVSIEATKAGHLRAANAAATSAQDREHVTPWIRARFPQTPFDRYRALQRDRYRLTIDTLDDLVSMDRVFPKDEAPQSVPWLEIVERADLGLYQPTCSNVSEDLILGCAQLGMKYGITNIDQVTPDTGRIMIRTAIANGVKWLDTARAYGQSEYVIGTVFDTGWDNRCRVVTKLSPLAGWSSDDPAKGARAAAEASLLTSLHSMRQARLDTLLLHRYAHWSAWNGAVADLLRDWVASGRILSLGVSVQTPAELEAALDVSEFLHFQIPCNILDYRWDPIIPKLNEARRKRRLTVHVRSSLLQGLLTTDDGQKWSMAGHEDWTATREWLRQTAERFEQQDVAALCLNWARALPWADGVVVGMDGMENLARNLDVFSMPPLSAKACASLALGRPQLREETLDPATWGRAA